MRRKITVVILLGFTFTFGYLFSNLNTKTINEVHASIEATYDKDVVLKDQLIIEMKKETDSLNKENEHLRQEISNLKKEINKEVEEIDAKFHGHTIYYTLNKRYSTLFRENTWNNGTKFTVDGNTYSNGIGFDRLENGNRNYYVAKLYNYNGEHSRLTGYIGVDDLAQDLTDSMITFAVFNNDEIIKCNNEFYGETLYKTQFKKSDGLKEIDVNLKGANNIIIEFSVEQSSDLNYFLLLEPKFK